MKDSNNFNMVLLSSKLPNLQTSIT